MPTGFEIAGVALAILPLVIEVAKSYTRGVNSIKNVIISERRDEKLQEFYEHFWWETYHLENTLRRIVIGLPLLCRECKEALSADRSLSMWEEDKEVKQALLLYFRDEEGVDAFILVLLKVLELVDRLTIRDKSTKLTAREKSSDGAYKRLKEFVDHRSKHNIKNTFIERFRFFKEEKNRNIALRNLKIWGKRLKALSESRTAKLEHLAVAKPSSLFSEIRQLFDAFVRVVGNHWTCNCPSRHNAMVCLRVWPSDIRESRPRNLEFHILLPRLENQQFCSQWLEATVLVESETAAHRMEKVTLSRLCDVFGEQVDSALRFLVCEKDRENTLWQMRSEPRRYSLLNDHPPTTLYDLLSSNPLTELNLKHKRLLAVTFAYAMLQCYPSSCFTDFLSEKSLYFYRLTATDLDFTAPFFSTEFHLTARIPVAANMSLQHRSLPILRLGIVLLQVHKGKLFESLLTASEVADTSPNRDLTAARRLVENLEEWCSDKYKNAIQACLELPWIPRGEAVDFANAEVCGGFIEKVIKPLESELEHMFTTKI
ncbi:hypothetical protein K469DRAFT_679973 [Zopfia rhizophila CBS 207.26]|uniref:DUF7580 domain-containing protein n=1 Tax=Zopfia rhizophila CBS 207.26 TaxID=1314779 RepID=A0A6A6D8R7_9PEZI|nr:hypothetical protein K469DRAFT_679973 [Zopfia rhizophila CBS 207.26]